MTNKLISCLAILWPSWLQKALKKSTFYDLEEGKKRTEDEKITLNVSRILKGHTVMEKLSQFIRWRFDWDKSYSSKIDTLLWIEDEVIINFKDNQKLAEDSFWIQVVKFKITNDDINKAGKAAGETQRIGGKIPLIGIITKTKLHEPENDNVTFKPDNCDTIIGTSLLLLLILTFSLMSFIPPFIFLLYRLAKLEPFGTKINVMEDNAMANADVTNAASVDVADAAMVDIFGATVLAAAATSNNPPFGVSISTTGTSIC